MNMKKLLFLLAFTSISYFGHAQANTFFDTLQYDFGNVKAGDTVVHAFNFTNKATIALIIEDVQTTWSCTASEYPKNPIKPGESSFVKIAFDSSDKLGKYAKGVNIQTNIGEINFIIFADVFITSQEE
jgi:hypothetical protein